MERIEIEKYNRSSAKSIETYAKKLIGKTFRQICEEDDINDRDYDNSHENKKRKGGLGELVEERYFHYEANNDSRPDFYEAGVELKVSPYKVDSKGGKTAKERLVIDMINYEDVVKETFETSRFWNKARVILLIYYLYRKEIKERLDYRIDYVTLFSPPAEDVQIIKHDFESIVAKIRAGKAHELSEADTLYLGASTKAAKSTDRRIQPYSDIPAKPRAFSFKNSYMTYVLNTYIMPGRVTYEPLIKGEKFSSFENLILERVRPYIGMTEIELCKRFSIQFDKKPKNLEAMLAFRILGIKGNHAEEFTKANIAVKTIRIGNNGKIKESMSFPTFRFKDIVDQEWEDSDLYHLLSETRFFFVVYQFDHEGELHLKGCQFWNIPYHDLDDNVRKVWEKTKQVLKEGLQVRKVNGRNTNNFPKASENPVCHVRPHAQNMYDTYELPDGRQYPKQCFWLNNSYILSQLTDKIKS